MFTHPGQQPGLLHVLLLAKPRLVPQSAGPERDSKEFMHQGTFHQKRRMWARDQDNPKQGHRI